MALTATGTCKGSFLTRTSGERKKGTTILASFPVDEKDGTSPAIVLRTDRIAASSIHLQQSRAIGSSVDVSVSAVDAWPWPILWIFEEAVTSQRPVFRYSFC
ncbi:uncharacterized protein MCYG_03307 [Microsporum canis CBS 113480]|uniref:Uncharacterized protein n=1 Tax=Arthroderma otae (strain ATCC MYA-4605 / CBS 113480) TaxID=554155 RepID=C5FLB6_ARTOC|nr:uncharacterized protein MCYG_03307 [Microsporum canis CBS 113480]EEQ30488.1 predicted protein [Microsporum canis CBS 113480]